MPWKKQTYVVHRWLALIVGLQLLAWSVGGFIFSILDIDDVHGDWERNFDPPPPIDVERIRVAPGDAIARAAEAGVEASEVVRATLRARPDGAVYELRPAPTMTCERRQPGLRSAAVPHPIRFFRNQSMLFVSDILSRFSNRAVPCFDTPVQIPRSIPRFWVLACDIIESKSMG